ncbi:PDR/VanB family oxidoreductase [Paraburkholderia sediminicola]|uniref:PDR/VanB family oxidoreductase n=1 Tax=Paraburkholderia sediminicola TaxID=458836 RepID=UPI0038B8EC31
MKKIQVVIEERSDEAQDVVRLALRRPDGESLPAFTAGAHIDLFLPNGLTRQYSLIGDVGETYCYEVAVSKVANGRGGSSCVHSTLNVGNTLDISEPRNNFPLQPGHNRFLFIAGGIGITPILSMIRYCERQGWAWQLLYLARSRAHAAFYQQLAAFGADRVRVHFDDEAGHFFDFSNGSLVVEPNVPIYCCGPAPVMKAVGEFSSSHPDNPAYFEWFSPPAGTETEVGTDQAAAAFDIKLQRSGKVLHVPEGKTILEVLEADGYELPCSCREGMCRTCETGVIEGTPEHRDYVLSKAEREAGRTMMICVSRARSPTLVLDI